MQNPFNYTRQNDSVKMEQAEQKNSWSRYSVKFPSAFPANSLGTSEVLGEYYLPQKSRCPLVILVHGMGESSMIPCRMITRTLLKKGIAVFILYLVFHNRRIPAELKTKYPSLSAEEWFDSYRLSVIDIRQVLDWAENRPEIDAGKIGIIGISFGSFVSSIALGMDERIKNCILVESGGNSDKLTRHSFLLSKVYKTDNEKFQLKQAAYFNYLEEIEKSGFENVEPSHSSYLTDPLTYTGLINGRPLMMVNALLDEMIPKVATRELWEAYGKPQISWFPATHASLWVWYPLIGRKIAQFYNRAFSGSGKG